MQLRMKFIFFFYCEFYQKTKEYHDFVLEFGLNGAEVKSLPAEEKWNRIWQSNDTKKLQTLAKFLYTAFKVRQNSL